MWSNCKMFQGCRLKNELLLTLFSSDIASLSIIIRWISVSPVSRKQLRPRGWDDLTLMQLVTLSWWGVTVMCVATSGVSLKAAGGCVQTSIRVPLWPSRKTTTNFNVTYFSSIIWMRAHKSYTRVRLYFSGFTRALFLSHTHICARTHNSIMWNNQSTSRNVKRFETTFLSIYIVNCDNSNFLDKWYKCELGTVLFVITRLYPLFLLMC